MRRRLTTCAITRTRAAAVRPARSVRLPLRWTSTTNRTLITSIGGDHGFRIWPPCTFHMTVKRSSRLKHYCQLLLVPVKTNQRSCGISQTKQKKPTVFIFFQFSYKIVTRCNKTSINQNTQLTFTATKKATQTESAFTLTLRSSSIFSFSTPLIIIFIISFFFNLYLDLNRSKLCHSFCHIPQSCCNFLSQFSPISSFPFSIYFAQTPFYKLYSLQLLTSLRASPFPFF